MKAIYHHSQGIDNPTGISIQERANNETYCALVCRAIAQAHERVIAATPIRLRAPPRYKNDIATRENPIARSMPCFAALIELADGSCSLLPLAVNVRGPTMLSNYAQVGEETTRSADDGWEDECGHSNSKKDQTKRQKRQKMLPGPRDEGQSVMRSTRRSSRSIPAMCIGQRVCFQKRLRQSSETHPSSSARTLK